MTGNEIELTRRLADGAPLLLDGATGTELERRGAPAALPLWSTHALVDDPGLVEQIHRDYVEAGAEVLTANTFRTQRHTLARASLGERAAQLTARAVSLARRAAGAAGEGRRVFVVGSAPPLEDCYRPDLVPEQAVLRREHGDHALHLAGAGVDAILVETQNCIREAVAAVEAAAATGLPVWVSFVCGAGARLLSGERLADALDAVVARHPAAVLVNCLPPSAVDSCLPSLVSTGLPYGVYPNLGAPTEGSGRSEECSPAELADRLEGWVHAGARLVGGCCGTTPEHIRAVAERLRG